MRVIVTEDLRVHLSMGNEAGWEEELRYHDKGREAGDWGGNEYRFRKEGMAISIFLTSQHGAVTGILNIAVVFLHADKAIIVRQKRFHSRARWTPIHDPRRVAKEINKLIESYEEGI